MSSAQIKWVDEREKRYTERNGICVNNGKPLYKKSNGIHGSLTVNEFLSEGESIVIIVNCIKANAIVYARMDAFCMFMIFGFGIGEFIFYPTRASTSVAVAKKKTPNETLRRDRIKCVVFEEFNFRANRS